MTNPGAASVSETVQVNADPAAVYALLTDLASFAELAEETQSMEWQKGSAATVGAVFTGHNRNGSKTWSTKCTVIEAAPGRAFGFKVTALGLPIARWRYDIEATGAGSRVTESTWDDRPRWFKVLAGSLTGVSDRGTANAEHIRLTLQRLKARAEDV